MATYYMRADGTAANKAAATSPDAAATAMSIATHNSETFSALDIIILSDAGGDYRDILICPSSGAAGSYITYQNSGSPIIRASDNALGAALDWSDEGGNVWSRAWAEDEPYICIFDGTTIGVKDATPAANYEYHWALNVLYVYAEANPATYYTDIEVGVRDNCINTNGKDYIIIDGIHCYGASPESLVYDGGGIYVNAGSNIIVRNCTVEFCFQYCIEVIATDTALIDSNIVRHTTANGGATNGDLIHVRPNAGMTHPKNVTVSNNTCSGVTGRSGIVTVGLDGGSFTNNTVNAQYFNAIGTAIDVEPGGAAYTVNDLSITYNTVTYGNISPCTGVAGVVENIICDHNSVDVMGVNTQGITFNTMLVGTNYCRHNTVVSTGAASLQVGITASCKAGEILTVSHNYISNFSNVYGSLAMQGSGTINAYYNIICDSGNTGIRCESAGGTYYIYNNVLYEYTSYGIYLAVTAHTVTIKNNILYTSGAPTHVFDRPNNTVICDYNCYYPTGLNFRIDDVGKNWAQWSAIYDTHGTNADPKFIDAGGGDFRLQAISPCRDAGVAVAGLTTDFEGKPVPMGSAPDIGAYEFPVPSPMGLNLGLGMGGRIPPRRRRR